MGKGDRRTRRGKISAGTHGKRRPRKPSGDRPRQNPGQKGRRRKK